MTIKQVIDKYYDELISNCSCDKVISQGRTECDICNDVCITAMNKYKNSDITEEEGLSYLKKTLFTEKHFQYARKKNEIIIYTDDLSQYTQ